MDAVLLDMILQDRKIAYAITDQVLYAIEMGGALDIFEQGVECGLGYPVLNLIPELVGYEEMLCEVLSGEIPRGEIPLINRSHPNGDIIYLTPIFLPYYGQTDEITGLLVLIDDVTEMGRSRQQLTQRRNELFLLKDQLVQQNDQLAMTNAELERLTEMKSKFVSIAAHELRTPITAISGYLEVLLDGDLGPIPTVQRDYLSIIQQSSERLYKLAENLLDITRIETEQIELILEPVDISDLIQQVLQNFEPLLRTKDLTLHYKPLSKAIYLLCDRIRTMQVINNLVSNAIRYTPSGGWIKMRLRPAVMEGFVEVSVADNGVGIAAKDQDKLFNPFFQAESGYQIDRNGAGLGLYIIRSLVELHGGNTWVESELGQGSVFYVTFPIAH